MNRCQKVEIDILIARGASFKNESPLRQLCSHKGRNVRLPPSSQFSDFRALHFSNVSKCLEWNANVPVGLVNYVFVSLNSTSGLDEIDGKLHYNSRWGTNARGRVESAAVAAAAASSEGVEGKLQLPARVCMWPRCLGSEKGTYTSWRPCRWLTRATRDLR